MFHITVPAQQKVTKKEYEKSKKEYEAMLKTMDPEERKDFEDQLKSMGIDLDKIIKDTEKSLDTTPSAIKKRSAEPEEFLDKTSALPIAATPQNKDELKKYLTPLFNETDQLIKPQSKNEIQNLLNKGSMIGKYAMAFWANKELDKALYLLLYICINNPEDYLAINNLGTLLTISGYAHKSLPLLLYIHKSLPQNSTIANNVGQAYLSLGYMDKAKEALHKAVQHDTTNVEAYRSLALIAQKLNQPAEEYVEKIIENDGATEQNIKLLEEIAPQMDKSKGYQRIRSRFIKYYKDHTITKRFIAPEIPNSYESSLSNYGDIEAFFADLKVTIQEAEKSKPNAEDQMMHSYKKHLEKFKNIANNIGKAGTAEMAQDLKAGLKPPLMYKALYMLSAMDDPRFSVSYTQRKQNEATSRQKKENALKLELKHKYDDKIEALKEEMATLNIGEGGSGNKRMKEIEVQICQLKTERQKAWIAQSAEINNYYIRNMEKLLNQELQERLFWYTLASQSLMDPTPVNYDTYLNYLKDISRFETLYHKVTMLNDRCDSDFNPSARKGKLRQWEREHCEVEFGFDVSIVGGKMDCSGFSIYGNIRAVELNYSRTYEPVFWETTSHSITIKVGIDKDFEIGKTGIGGNIGLSTEGTIRVDPNMNIEDWVLKATAGAAINDGNAIHPSGGGDGAVIGSLGADLGSVSISARGGFNTSGPGFTGLGSNFLK